MMPDFDAANVGIIWMVGKFFSVAGCHCCQLPVMTFTA